MATQVTNYQCPACTCLLYTSGTDTKVLLDEDAGKFMVTRTRNLVEANPDVLDFACLLYTSRHRHIACENPDPIDLFNIRASIGQ